MHIVDVCGFYSPEGGGIRTYIEQKLRLAELLGQEITILAPGAKNGVQQVSPSSRIVRLQSPNFPLDRKYFAFTDRGSVHAALDRLQPDFIEASSPWKSAQFVAEYPRRVPRSLVMHSDPLAAHAYRWFEGLAAPNSIDRAFDWFWRRLRRFGREFDVVVAANSSLTKRLQDGGVPNAVTLPMGVEPGLFSPGKRQECVRTILLATCELPPDATLLVSAGRLATEKRIPMLVEAATVAGRQRQIGLVIFGEGRAHKKILRVIDGNPHVRLLQPVRDRELFATILASADALLHGCEAETFGMIAAEAHASGIPVIAPRGGGAGDFVRHDPALGFRPTDTADVVRAILELPHGGSSSRIAPAARSVEQHFRELFALYHALAQSALAVA
ncbi:glycosyltransferase [Stakelama pacifica]|uniref:Alpha-1,6-mannosyltransferase n=1 Tax=Stakelama pacifica TaxID=517720 RepID=A0A4R6FCP8_9SPHN|nr:glycosyltransferase [Stakelama pacifica]MAW99418.1 glycosyl transferase family 1 [Sphingomonas sp.]TDN78966.1 alpha-1,6-mannosyltransferase [Stakelama pacifica]GGO98993.1 glycosyl transferase family 1 [Stakelama pacifica]